MKYIDEFRMKENCRFVAGKISSIWNNQKVSIMEVCGTHTMALFRYGIRELLPRSFTLLSGPGCPVCVTSNSSIDRAVALAKKEDVIIATFGDMIKVPGSSSSLSQERSLGADVRIVYSPLDSLRIAEDNPEKEVVFLGVGFETTAPSVAMTVKEAFLRGMANVSVLCCHKLIPPALDFLLESGNVAIDGLILPGHVSVIIGTEPYEFIPQRYGKACAVSGFEPLDILQAILMLAHQVRKKHPIVENQYTRAVRKKGNEHALKAMDEVFDVCDSEWRGLGVVPKSGLCIRERFRDHDAMNIAANVEQSKEYPGCLCGAILRGEKRPPDCSLFGTRCVPEEPKGPCMVSSEGTCAAYYKYRT